MYTGVAVVVVAMGTDCSTSEKGALVELLLLLLLLGGRGGGTGRVGGSRTVEGLSALGAATAADTVVVRVGLAVVVVASCGAGVVSTSPRFSMRSAEGDGDGSHEKGGKVVYIERE
jgi:hypothetical protein